MFVAVAVAVNDHVNVNVNVNVNGSLACAGGCGSQRRVLGEGSFALIHGRGASDRVGHQHGEEHREIHQRGVEELLRPGIAGGSQGVGHADARAH